MMLSKVLSLTVVTLALGFLNNSVVAGPVSPGLDGEPLIERAAAPSVTLDAGVFTGAATSGVEKFLGIPFAKPPVGDLRFRLPVPIPAYSGAYEATEYGLSCPQQGITLPIISGMPAEAINYLINSIYGLILPGGEDCLTINIIRPAGTTATSKLPVAAWIFGGGFQLGSPTMYDGTSIVKRSVEMKTPVIYVSMNYRVSAWGFLASKEVKDAGLGNLGLHDQRQALRWVQKYIGKFGGDPTKVTIWGESAGGISVALQMVNNGGNAEGLFRGGFMQSGSAIPVGDITNGQGLYDSLVDTTGCKGSADTLDCLRKLPYAKLKAAVDKGPGIFSYKSVVSGYLPRADGVFLTDNPQVLAAAGKVAKIPYVTGDVEDEGTLFALTTLNVTTDAQLKTYIQTQFLPGITDAQYATIAQEYPGDITQGSPYNTGVLYALTPQFKRIASFIGDGVFQAPRRFFLQKTAATQPAWSFLSKRLALPQLGSVHGSDILNVYAGGDLTDYLINFVVYLNPNGPSGSAWPRYDVNNPKALALFDGLIPRVVVSDDYRKEGMAALSRVTLTSPV